MAVKVARPVDGQCFDCQCCTDCCRGYLQIRLTPDEAARVRALADDVDCVVEEPAGLLLAHRGDGTCVFLREDGLCRLHADHGAAAKPLACRLYPFTFVPSDGALRVDLRFRCPSAAASVGRPLPAHQAELSELARELVPPGRAVVVSPPNLSAGQRADWALVRALRDTLLAVLEAPSQPPARRPLVLALLADGLRCVPPTGLSEVELSRVLETVASQAARAVDDLALAGAVRGLRGVMFRQLLGIYGRTDRLGGEESGRLADALRWVAGRGVVPIEGEVSFAAIASHSGQATPAALAAQLRYYRVKASADAWFGPGFYFCSLVDGLAALGLTVALLGWHARRLAVVAGSELVDEAEVVAAVRLIDHHHGRSPLLGLAPQQRTLRWLAAPPVLRTLVGRWALRAQSAEGEADRDAKLASPEHDR